MCGRLSNGPQRDGLPIPRTPQSDFIWKRGVFADVIKFRVLWWRVYPALSGWALPAITNSLTGQRRGDSADTREAVGRQADNGAIHPQAEGPLQPSEAGRSKELILL